MTPSPSEPPATPASSTSPSPTTPEQRRVLLIAILASFVAFLDGTVANVALPAIMREFGGGIATQQWVVDAYLVTLGALILVAGSVSDLYGRIRVLTVGLIGFGVTSLAIALAPNAEVLVAARFAQGAAAALLVPSSLALITSSFRGAAQAKAIGTWTAATSGAMILGPVLGGLAVDLASWRWAFAINLAPIAWTLVLIARLEQRDARTAGVRIDLPGALLGAAGLGAAVYALIELPTRGAASPLVWGTGAAGAVLLAAFLVRQATAAAPMLPLSLFRVRNFGWGNLSTWFVYGALALVSFLVSVYLQEGAGLSATQAGLATMPIVLALMLLSSRAGAWAGRYGARLFMTVGPVVAGLGALWMLAVGSDFNYWAQVLPGVCVMGVGIALTVSPLTSAILGALPPERAGIASATNNAVARIAGLVAVALVGVIVGGALDLNGLHRGLGVTAVLLVVGGAVSWIGIRPTAEAPTA